jgi:hypothetical protein
MDGFWDTYQAPSLPKVWIIGTDGKIKFAGNPGYKKVLDAELAKVKYPGLGKDNVAKALEPAAKLFVEGKYADAYNAAQTVFEETEDTAAEDDADLIMKRIDSRARALTTRGETAEAERDYEVAIRCWQALAQYKGIDEAAEAPERLKKLQESESVKKETVARRALLAEMLSLDVGYATIDPTKEEDVRKFREKCLAAYKKFATDNKGTAAAERAEELAEVFTELLEAPQESPKEEPAAPPKKE